MRTTLIALIALLWMSGSVHAQTSREESFSVAVRTDADGREYCSIDAQQASVDRVVEALAKELGALPGHDSVFVEGFTPPLRAALVTTLINDREVDTALEWILGSVGLSFRRRPGVISVFAEESAALDVEALTSRAMLAYVRATRRFADHPMAATARMHQGRIEDARGNLSAALSHFEALQENYRESRHLPEAVWRRGMVMERIGSWAEASLAFRTLANFPDEHAWHAAARLEMARCALELGDPIRARHILAALDESHPATNHDERTDRRIVSARAELQAGHAMNCLRALEPTLGGKLSDEQRASIFGMQAQAFEELDMLSEAAWAWQVRADVVDGNDLAIALENAARLSLASGEELNVLFLEKLARERLTDPSGLERIEPYAQKASIRLGIGTAEVAPGDGDVMVTVERGSKLLAAGDAAGASRLLEPLFRDRDGLTDDQAVALLPVWGQCLAELRGIDAAARMLSRARDRFEAIEQRRRIDLAAAALFEKEELFERAVEAYEGRY